ncbi:MAG: DUF4160 domain-containing protein [Bdellovibrionota bacterium]
MSTVVTIKGVRFQVLSKDHEPPHCHVFYQGAKARVRLDTLEVMDARGFSAKALTDIQRAVAQNQAALLAKWEEYHGEEEDDDQEG